MVCVMWERWTSMLLDFSLKEIQQLALQKGFPSFRGKQIFDAIMNGKNINQSNLPKDIKEQIQEEYPNFEIVKKLVSKDGTIKYALRMKDGQVVESVLMSHDYGKTLCVSSQVGCAMGCKFCASSLNGLVRNLTAGEILQQVVIVNKDLGGMIKKRAITNIVLMGMGEPLDNYENVTKFLKLVCDEDGFNFSERNITLSTCGIVPKIYQLADDGFSVTLTISLHATSDDKRKQTMPIANAYSIKQIIDACKYYFKKTGRRISFEYALIAGQNDSNQDAEKLAGLVKGLNCHINIIPLNDVKERGLKGTEIRKAYAFVEKLNSLGVTATKRRSMGEDIAGACGQLRQSVIKEEA